LFMEHTRQNGMFSEAFATAMCPRRHRDRRAAPSDDRT
jgi:hypothetical protein